MVVIKICMHAKRYGNNNIKIACMQEDKFELKKLGEHLKKLRKSRKLTLESLCYRNGLEPSTVSRIEQGIVEPKYLTLLRLSDAFDMTISELLDIK